jgi:predicted nucleic acid-binding Zn ribbon protein
MDRSTVVNNGAHVNNYTKRSGHKCLFFFLVFIVIAILVSLATR